MAKDPFLELVEEIAGSSGRVPSDRLAARGIGLEVRGDVVVLEPPPSTDAVALARAVRDLGPPLRVDIVSPPVLDPGRPDSRPPWDVKQSLDHDIAGQRVSFGLETVEGVERLVTVSIRRSAATRDRLPPEGRDGPFQVTVSLGWTGGHGEAVLDETGAIRFHEGMPIFFDPESWTGILDGLDLSGGFVGSPVVRVAGAGRLERRRAVNPSVPGAPEEDHVVLVPALVREARVVGERAG